MNASGNALLWKASLAAALILFAIYAALPSPFLEREEKQIHANVTANIYVGMPADSARRWLEQEGFSVDEFDKPSGLVARKQLRGELLFVFWYERSFRVVALLNEKRELTTVESQPEYRGL